MGVEFVKTDEKAIVEGIKCFREEGERFEEAKEKDNKAEMKSHSFKSAYYKCLKSNDMFFPKNGEDCKTFIGTTFEERLGRRFCLPTNECFRWKTVVTREYSVELCHENNRRCIRTAIKILDTPFELESLNAEQEDTRPLSLLEGVLSLFAITLNEDNISFPILGSFSLN